MLVLAAAVTTLVAQPQPTSASRPDLIVVISIDQFPYRYIETFRPYFASDGFNRFLDRGANFTQAKYSYATTFTGPGHAAIGSGHTPSRSGIIANTWFDRLDGAPMYCVNDSQVTPPFSPLNLQSDSLGDRLQEKYPGSKVFGVAIKDRAAILMAGRKATAAYWFEPLNERFTSSSYYSKASRTLVAEYNKTIPDYVKAHPVWEQSSFIPPEALQKLTHDPENLRKYKSNRAGLGVSFPHPIRGADAITYTPFGNGLVIGFAERLIESENVGTEDDSPDLVFVSLSSPDYLGHNYGPESLEVADTVVRTDRDLAGFLEFLDRTFGDRYTVALTADHGVQSIPEVARDMGRDAGRVSLRNPGANIRTFGELAEIAPARFELEKRVAAALGHPIAEKTSIDDEIILYFEEPAVYLNWIRIHELKLDGERVKRLVRNAATKLPGVSAAFTNSELLAPNRDASELEKIVRRSFRADRSGDVLITLKPGYIWDYNGTGTTHGQPVDADQHVPVMLYGRGIKHLSSNEPVAPTDIAKTLGALVGLDAGDADTQVLPCVSAAAAKAAP
ncbi:MAG: alkaline phosphatase family protein [Fimbriimonadales bacterium]